MEYVSIVFQEVYRILFLLVPVLVSVAMVVWLDRRVWAFVQKRQGPNVVGPFGLLQSLADALKYIFKEIIIPSSSNKVIFILAPIVTMTLALIAWAVIPFSATQVLADINVGILYLVCSFFTRRLWNYYGRLGFKLKISLSRCNSISCTNGII